MGVSGATLAALAQGAGSTFTLDVAVARLFPRHRTKVAAVGLLGAAPAYPLSRRRLGIDIGEAATVAAACALVAVATRLPDQSAHRLLGAGWVAHAAYDAAFKHDTEITRLPDTYPAACAGADIAIGLRLMFL